MKLFLDTNVILEYIEHRRFYDDVRCILMAVCEGKHKGMISQGCVYTLAFLVERSLKANNIHRPELTIKLRQLLGSILNMVEPAGISRKEMLGALSDEAFKDLEDSFQYQCALKNHCQVLITINIGDFKDADQSHLEILTPAAFVRKYLMT